ncbi:MAG TPA: hypothetical protein VE713_03480 [Pyrinomonadaceae bacterium]|jgi:hypothetical protein|nr:hypothetical protein [Pyrinomonadaceae bacterium]
MKESPSRVVALTSYTLRTKAGTLRVEDDGHRWTPGDGLPPKGVQANPALALCARASELWRGDPQKGVKAHPVKALAAQVEWLRKRLPELKPEPEAEAVKKSPSKLPVGEYERRREEAIAKALEDAADEIEERDGDSDLWLEKMEKLVRRMRDSRRKTEPARRSWIIPDEEVSDSGNT